MYTIRKPAYPNRLQLLLRIEFQNLCYLASSVLAGKSWSSSGHGSCKCFRSLIWISRLKSIICTLTRILFLSCRMEIQRCRRNGFFGIGFIDPYTIHGPNIAKYPNRMRNTIAHFFNKQHHKEIILFPYNFGWVIQPFSHPLIICA